MGTRHLQTVINKQGQVKVSQYGQWDGYPSGQGVEILEYLRGGNLKKYQSELNKIPQATQEVLKKIDEEHGEDWKTHYPYLSRDCGSKIHKMIEDGEVKLVVLETMEEAVKWCEGFYTIDFSKNIFTSEFYDKTVSYPLDSLPTNEEYISYFQVDDNE